MSELRDFKSAASSLQFLMREDRLKKNKICRKSRRMLNVTLYTFFIIFPFNYEYVLNVYHFVCYSIQKSVVLCLRLSKCFVLFSLRQVENGGEDSVHSAVQVTTMLPISTRSNLPIKRCIIADHFKLNLDSTC